MFKKFMRLSHIGATRVEGKEDLAEYFAFYKLGNDDTLTKEKVLTLDSSPSGIKMTFEEGYEFVEWNTAMGANQMDATNELDVILFQFYTYLEIQSKIEKVVLGVIEKHYQDNLFNPVILAKQKEYFQNGYEELGRTVTSHNFLNAMQYVAPAISFKKQVATQPCWKNPALQDKLAYMFKSLDLYLHSVLSSMEEADKEQVKEFLKV